MNKRLKDLLLEYDPKQSGTRAVSTKRGGRAHASKVAGIDAVTGEIERADKAHLRHKTNLPSLNKKVIKKAQHRAMNRGTPLKGAGPKGKLPEAIEQALLEYDPKKAVTTPAKAKISGKAQFAADRERFRTDSPSEKKIKKVKTRALARGGASEMKAGPKGKLPEAIEQALLEYDPKKEGFLGRKKHPGKEISRQSAAATRVYLDATKRGDKSREKANDWGSKGRDLAFKAANKSDNRQLARGGEATPIIGHAPRGYNVKGKIAGPKGKLPEALEKALLEYDPRKGDTHKSMKAFGKELGKGQTWKKSKKSANRTLARGKGDVLGSPKAKLVRRDIARDIRSMNRKIKSTLGN